MLTRTHIEWLDYVEAGEKDGHVGMFSGMGYRRHDAEELVGLGLLMHVDLQPTEADGLALYSRAPRRGYSLTVPGRAALADARANPTPVRLSADQIFETWGDAGRQIYAVDAADTVRNLAAAALHELLHDMTNESFLCAGWIDDAPGVPGTPLGIWRWLRGEGNWHEGNGPIDPAQATVVKGLVDACGLWWSDCDTAVPVADWVGLHGHAW